MKYFKSVLFLFSLVVGLFVYQSCCQKKTYKLFAKKVFFNIHNNRDTLHFSTKYHFRVFFEQQSVDRFVPSSLISTAYADGTICSPKNDFIVDSVETLSIVDLLDNNIEVSNDVRTVGEPSLTMKEAINKSPYPVEFYFIFNPKEKISKNYQFAVNIKYKSGIELQDTTKVIYLYTE